jgi:hypothetical protein
MHMKSESAPPLIDSPQVTLGGRSWPVPPLAVRQNRVIDPLILSLLPTFAALDAEQAALRLQAKEYDALLLIAYTALTRAHPQLTREAFDEMPITLPELIGAFETIARQTGLFVKREATEGTPGE